jgi:hypothetical protein
MAPKIVFAISRGHIGTLQTARKPNSVLDDHSSRRRITAALQQPTRRFRLPEGSLRLGAPGRYAIAAWRGAAISLPIWSCSVWGLPCRRHYWRRGALLPHLFTLTPRLRRRRYVLCCTGRPDGLNHPSRTLSGTLPCGVRTFLPRPCERQRSSGRLHLQVYMKTSALPRGPTARGGHFVTRGRLRLAAPVGRLINFYADQREAQAEGDHTPRSGRCPRRTPARTAHVLHSQPKQKGLYRRIEALLFSIFEGEPYGFVRRNATRSSISVSVKFGCGGIGGLASGIPSLAT